VREQLWFVFKTFITTILMVMVLQVRLGQNTVEQHVMRLYYTSAISVPIQQAVDGGVRAIHVGWKSTLNFISLKDRAGKSRWPFHIERHPKALEKQENESEENLN